MALRELPSPCSSAMQRAAHPPCTVAASMWRGHEVMALAVHAWRDACTHNCLVVGMQYELLCFASPAIYCQKAQSVVMYAVLTPCSCAWRMRIPGHRSLHLAVTLAG